MFRSGPVSELVREASFFFFKKKRVQRLWITDLVQILHMDKFYSKSELISSKVHRYIFKICKNKMQETVILTPLLILIMLTLY